jgi:hypothetical protein
MQEEPSKGRASKTIPFEAGFYAVCGRSQLATHRLAFKARPVQERRQEVRTAKIVWLA